MPLVTCPDCEKRHSDAAPACPECGRPNALAAAPALAPQPAPALPDARYAQGAVVPRLVCSRCGSTEVRKLSLVYREGTTRITAGADAVASSRSLLSLGAAPPAMRDSAAAAEVAGGVAAVALLLVSASVGSWGVTAIALVVTLLLLAAVATVAVSESTWNRHVYPGLLQQWDSTFLCTRCENRFIPGTDASGPPGATAGLP